MYGDNMEPITDKDKQCIIDFLNLVAQHAEFKYNTEKAIEHVGLLSRLQRDVLPKIIELSKKPEYKAKIEVAEKEEKEQAKKPKRKPQRKASVKSKEN